MQATSTHAEIESWVQVAGDIAVQRHGHVPVRPEGSTRTLLAVLVAAGPSGASFEDLASAYWGNNRPDSWRTALRSSNGHLAKLLPSGWTVSTTDTNVCLCPSPGGWVDTWRLDDLGETTQRPRWIQSTDFFPGISGIKVIDDARTELEARSQWHDDEPTNPTIAQTVDTIRNVRRSIVLCSPDQERAIFDQLDDLNTTTHFVIGDRDLALPFGPFIVAFPELRGEFDTTTEGLDASTHQAWQILAEQLGTATTDKPVRLVVCSAHDLDTPSQMLTSLLIERGPLSHSSLLIFAHPNSKRPDWLDFIDRAITAGSELLDLSAS